MYVFAVLRLSATQIEMRCVHVPEYLGSSGAAGTEAGASGATISPPLPTKGKQFVVQASQIAGKAQREPEIPEYFSYPPPCRTDPHDGRE